MNIKKIVLLGLVMTASGAPAMGMSGGDDKNKTEQSWFNWKTVTGLAVAGVGAYAAYRYGLFGKTKNWYKYGHFADDQTIKSSLNVMFGTLSEIARPKLEQIASDKKNLRQWCEDYGNLIVEFGHLPAEGFRNFYKKCQSTSLDPLWCLDELQAYLLLRGGFGRSNGGWAYKEICNCMNRNPIFLSLNKAFIENDAELLSKIKNGINKTYREFLYTPKHAHCLSDTFKKMLFQLHERELVATRNTAKKIFGVTELMKTFVAAGKK